MQPAPSQYIPAGQVPFPGSTYGVIVHDGVAALAGTIASHPTAASMAASAAHASAPSASEGPESGGREAGVIRTEPRGGGRRRRAVAYQRVRRGVAPSPPIRPSETRKGACERRSTTAPATPAAPAMKQTSAVTASRWAVASLFSYWLYPSVSVVVVPLGRSASAFTPYAVPIASPATPMTAALAVSQSKRP